MRQDKSAVAGNIVFLNIAGWQLVFNAILISHIFLYRFGSVASLVILKINFIKHRELLCSLENIEFNDLFEFLYTMKYGEKIDEKKYASGIPKVEFEEVVTTYFDISIETLEIYAQYDDVKGVYPWEAIGPWNRIQQFQPFPEVVNCIENEDGSLTLTVEAVFQEEGTDCSFRHEVTIREEGDKWIYLGNCIEREGAYKIPEYKPRRDF